MLFNTHLLIDVSSATYLVDNFVLIWLWNRPRSIYGNRDEISGCIADDLLYS